MENSEEEDFDDEGLEGIDLEDEQDMGSRTIQVGDKNFTFSFAWNLHFQVFYSDCK